MGNRAVRWLRFSVNVLLYHRGEEVLSRTGGPFATELRVASGAEVFEHRTRGFGIYFPGALIICSCTERIENARQCKQQLATFGGGDLPLVHLSTLVGPIEVNRR